MGALFPEYFDHIEALHQPIDYGQLSLVIKKHKGGVSKLEATVSKSYKFKDPTNHLPFATVMQVIKNATKAQMRGAISFSLNLSDPATERGPSVINQLVETDHIELNYMK